MKRISLMAGVASVAAMVAVLWSLPAVAQMGGPPTSAVRQPQDKMPVRVSNWQKDSDGDTNDPPSGVPEPGTLALFALGLSGIAVAAAKRRRTRS
jgi:hypothetical protein